jgi:membrane protease YdiL (CAAX protease family)
MEKTKKAMFILTGKSFLNNKLYISLVIFLIYFVSRYFIYAVVPNVDFQSWLFRDSIMNFPRIVCLLLVVAFTFDHRRRKKDLYPNLSGKKRAFIVGVLLMLPIILRLFCFEIKTYSFEFTLLFVLNSFVVGFFEEALFRGGFFDSLNGMLGSKSAVWFSSFLFMIFHIQAQDVTLFPGIFIFGIICALLRRDGVSLFLLSLIHSIYDSLILFNTSPYEMMGTLELYDVIYSMGIVLGYLRYSSIRSKSPLKMIDSEMSS